jgi:energy-converting hydrogenase Eha subunit B
MFGLFFILAAAAAVFYVAGDIHGSVVAADICRAGGTLCRQPQYLATAAGAMGLIWLLVRNVVR